MKAHPSVRTRNASLSLLGAVLVLASTAAKSATTTAEDPIELYIADQISYEDNLFRLPSAALDFGNFITSRSDWVNRASAGVEGRIDFARQILRLDVNLEDVRYQDNDFLDHIAGAGALTWEWQLGSRWSGTLDARYERELANFANARYLGKDMVESQSYAGEAFYRVGPRFRLYGGSRHARGDHSAEARRNDDFESNSGWFGLLFGTPAGTNVRLEHRYTTTEFPQLAALGSPRDREYDEHITFVRAAYRPTVRTSLQASYGRVDRDYAQLDNGDFSGGIWRVGVNWAPRTQFQMALNAWRELRANIDSESDYFVSKGVSLTPTWTPRRMLSFSMALIYEKQTYMGSNPALESSTDREDRARAATFIVGYTPIHPLRVDLSYRLEDRRSNRPFFDYDACVAALNVRWAL